MEDTEILSKQLERHTEKLEILKKSDEYNKSVTELNRVNRDFSEKWADYKRELKEREEQDGLKLIRSEIKNTEQHIKDLKEELKNEPEEKDKTYHD